MKYSPTWSCKPPSGATPSPNGVCLQEFYLSSAVPHWWPKTGDRLLLNIGHSWPCRLDARTPEHSGQIGNCVYTCTYVATDDLIM